MLAIEQMASSFDAGYLNLFLLPTERCNFRCTYCYEDFNIGRMRPAVSAGVKALISTRFSELHTLEISWFGGEPLVAKSIIEDISLHIKHLGKSKLINYKANITTNGYLLDLATATRLRELGITFYQISLDGPPEVHDVSRVRTDGSGTFARIWSNLLDLKKSSLDIKIVLRVHFSPETYKSLDSLIDAINHEFGGDDRFAVFFKAVERLGGPNDSSIPTFNLEQKNHVKNQLIDKIDRSLQTYDVTGSCETYICYASKPNSFVIRANGDVAKCTVALYDEGNRVGKLLTNGEIVIDQEKLRWWMRGFGSLKEEELTCPHGAARNQPALQEG
jgi:uncharacterized protein